MIKIANFTSRFLVAAVLLGASGCKTYEMLPLGLATAAGFGAAELSDGDGVATAAAVAGTYVATELIINKLEEDKRTEYARGYEQARSDAVKDLYWNKVALDGAATALSADKDESPYPEPKKKYILKSMPTRTSDGRHLEDHYVQIPILE